MVVVRSVRMETFTAAGSELCSCGSSFLIRSTTSMTFAPGCRWMLTITAGVSFIQAACFTFSASSTASATSESSTGAFVAVGDDQGPVLLARKELVVGADDVGLPRPVEAALCLVDVGCGNGRAQVFEGQAVGGQGRGVGLDPHGRPLPAADADEPHAGKLRDLLGEPRVRQVLHLRQGQRVGGQGQRQDRRIGRIHLAVDRRVRKIPRQEGGGGIDGRLHLLLGNVEAEVEAELERDDRTAAGARGGHLLQAGHLAELALEGRRDG